MKLSFVIPAFNEEENIRTIYERLITLTNKYSEIDYEIIFINDGSSDKTLSILKELSTENKSLKYIDLSRNFGHQAALWAGLLHASGDAIISLDCDLQDPPELIEQMITKWQEGFEVVYARRLNFRDDSFMKKIGSKIYYKLLDKITNIDIPQNVGDFRLIDKKVLKELKKMKERSKYIRGMVAWIGFKSSFVDYERPDREKGTSKYTLRKLIGLAISGMMNFSHIPLKLGLYMGVISIIAGFFLLGYQLVDVVINDAYYHLYKWLVVVIFIFIGFLFMLIWILGEYIARIYDEIRDRPLFIARDKINF